MDDILSQIIAYAPDKIDTELKAAALVQGSRNMDQEPRMQFNNGLSVDPERDSFKKISNVLGAYKRYRRGEKNPKLNFNQFFELYSTENFAEGGQIRQNYNNGAEVMTLNPLFPTKDIDSQDFQPIDVPGAIIPPLAIGAGAKRLSDILFNKNEDESKEEIVNRLEKIEDDKKDPEQEPPKDPFEPDTFTQIKELADAYRKNKTKEGKTQPTMKEYEKLELVNKVVNKFTELEGRLPNAKELQNLPGTKQISNLFEILKENKIELNKIKTDFDRTDPKYISKMEDNAQNKAIEENTISIFGNKNFYPDKITLPNGNVVDAKSFFEKNLVEKINFGPGRKDNPALQNKELAKLFNTNIRKIEKATKIIKDSPDFKADYPEPRPVNYGNQQAVKRLKEARKYLTESELANIKIQEKELNNLNTRFKTGELVVTDYPNLVKAMNTTLDKETGKLDFSIKKTNKEMIERSKNNDGLFDISHTIAKTSGQKNIEFLKNRNILDYKTNQGLFKSMEAYVRNKQDDPEYDLRLEEFDSYMKEMNQFVKIGNKFFGKEQAMINSETGELLGMNSQLDYFGLPKFENGVSLKKIKKAAGGVIPDQEIMNYANGGRINYENGSPRGPNEPEGDSFLNELEFKFNNIDSVTLDDTPTTFDDSKSKIAQVADLADPRNIPYYADMAGQAALRVGEFGARVLPATGNLISDVLQKPMFKVKSSYLRDGEGEILDYGETTKEDNVKFVGGPIFKNFLQNITPTSTEKLVGLDTLINEEKKKMIARGSSSLPVKVAETASLGAELVAPIFPGLKIIRAYAKAKGIKPTKEVAKTIEQEIDAMAKAEGMNRREFLVASGAVGTLGLAKLLGISSELPKVAKVAEKVASSGAVAPPYFLNLVAKIKNLGNDITQTGALIERQTVTKYKDYELTEDFAGNIEITKKGIMDEPDTPEVFMSLKVDEVPLKGKKGSTKVQEYEEFTGKRDYKGDLDVEPGVPDEVVQEGTVFEDTLSEFGK